MTETAAPPKLLPTQKTPPKLGLNSMKLLLWGPPKVGKTTLAAEFDPDRTLFLATEPGLSGLETFQVPIRTWAEFLQVMEELKGEEHPYKLIVVDTVDELARMCSEHVVEGLNAGLSKPNKGYVHVSDFEWGKGQNAVAEEFRLRCARLCTLGAGVIFISHAKESTKKDRTGKELTVFSPDVGAKGQRQWLLGFVDYIFFASVEDGEDGAARRVLHTRPTETYEAGNRGAPLPDPLELDAKAVRKALGDAAKQTKDAAA